MLGRIAPLSPPMGSGACYHGISSAAEVRGVSQESCFANGSIEVSASVSLKPVVGSCVWRPSMLTRW